MQRRVLLRGNSKGGLRRRMSVSEWDQDLSPSHLKRAFREANGGGEEMSILVRSGKRTALRMGMLQYSFDIL